MDQHGVNFLNNENLMINGNVVLTSPNIIFENPQDKILYGNDNFKNNNSITLKGKKSILIFLEEKILNNLESNVSIKSKKKINQARKYKLLRIQTSILVSNQVFVRITKIWQNKYLYFSNLLSLIILNTSIHLHYYLYLYYYIYYNELLVFIMIYTNFSL